MVKAVDPFRVFSGVHPSDKDLPEHEQTVWNWTGLTVAEERYVQDRLAGYQDDAEGKATVFSRDGTLVHLRLKFGLRPPERFTAEWADEPHGVCRKGKLVPTDDFLDKIPRQVRSWLALRIGEATALSEADAGKSSRPSTSPSGASPPTVESAAATTAAS